MDLTTPPLFIVFHSFIKQYQHLLANSNLSWWKFYLSPTTKLFLVLFKLFSCHYFFNLFLEPQSKRPLMLPI